MEARRAKGISRGEKTEQSKRTAETRNSAPSYHTPRPSPDLDKRCTIQIPLKEIGTCININLPISLRSTQQLCVLCNTNTSYCEFGALVIGFNNCWLPSPPHALTSPSCRMPPTEKNLAIVQHTVFTWDTHKQERLHSLTRDKRRILSLSIPFPSLHRFLTRQSLSTIHFFPTYHHPPTPPNILDETDQEVVVSPTITQRKGTGRIKEGYHSSRVSSGIVHMLARLTSEPLDSPRPVYHPSVTCTVCTIRFRQYAW